MKTTRHSLAEMQAHAEALVAELAPYCERIEIAGSIRRGKPEVSDIELVVIPRLRKERSGLFDVVVVDLLHEYAKTQLYSDAWQFRRNKLGASAFGERYKRLLVRDIALDLFSVLEPAQWGVVFLIRTGPAEFSRRLVTGSDAGGWMTPGWLVRGGAIRDAGFRVVPTPEERDVFRVLGREWVDPEERR